MTSVLTVALVAAFTQMPGGSCPNCQAGGAGYGNGGYSAPYYDEGSQGGYAGNASGYGTGPVSYSGSYSGVGGPVGLGSGGYDQLYPFDDARPWVHGYFQEIPSYGGYSKFRPYNYRHVLSQSQTAAGWGMSPTAGYSQEVFRRYPPLNPTTTSNRRTAPSNDEATYRAEMARLRAQRDFTRTQSPSEPQTQRSEVPAQTASSQVLRAPTVSTAVHTQSRSPKVDELHAKLRQQQRELQQLQDEIDRAQQD